MELLNNRFFLAIIWNNLVQLTILFAVGIATGFFIANHDVYKNPTFSLQL
ncbi:MAG: hypothetical protein ABFS12_06010 [Bacteroidota bacterium]